MPSPQAPAKLPQSGAGTDRGICLPAHSQGAGCWPHGLGKLLTLRKPPTSSCESQAPAPTSTPCALLSHRPTARSYSM